MNGKLEQLKSDQSKMESIESQSLELKKKLLMKE